ncbi:hypothetical protein EVAR_69189_1 [Eumeta japonica]|uniref:Uncharacterized protein n=1 Tax=Eumeta variegata TaxID=151549 RepID=A0A4C2AGW7_EUMVA|nr:hypothetical protein EVAR_69189_1 [Eumeta japonica]
MIALFARSHALVNLAITRKWVGSTCEYFIEYTFEVTAPAIAFLLMSENCGGPLPPLSSHSPYPSLSYPSISLLLPRYPISIQKGGNALVTLLEDTTADRNITAIEYTNDDETRNESSSEGIMKILKCAKAGKTVGYVRVLSEMLRVGGGTVAAELRKAIVVPLNKEEAAIREM